MDAFRIEGGHRLKGTVRVNGSKNAALPLMAAALLTDQPVTLHDVPNLSDIRNLCKLLEELGCTCERDGGTLRLHTTDISNSRASYEIVSTMRASICVLGPLLAARGRAEVSMPGGCAIGERPVDLHLRGLRALGAEIDLEQGYIVARSKRMHGTKLFLGGQFGSTVLGTANVICAAALAEGQTVIEQAACEPEVVDLCNLLLAMGAKISGQGSPRVIIEGVPSLSGAEHRVLPDRIEAATYMAAAGITNGDVTIENCPTDVMTAITDRLHHVGLNLETIDGTDPMRQTVNITSDRRLAPVAVTTQPYPGFPTDVQAQLMALLTLADGNSIITEKVFPERFLHVAELSRMGANLYRQGPTVMVIGVKQLHAAPVMASDLRASAGLVLAGLAARGVTQINRVYHLDRGYEHMETRLQALGAEIERISV